MSYDRGIPERLKAKGVPYKLCSGWESRGSSSFDPLGFVRHHTAGAGPSAGKTPSLQTCIYGRSDLAGPLCNIYLSYGPNPFVYVVAAGRANHAGTPDGGSYKGMTGNTTSWGFEIEHPGTYPLAGDQLEIAAAACAAIIDGTCDQSMVCDHKEWAPSRKIDLATSPSPGAFRSRVAYYLDNTYGGVVVAVPRARNVVIPVA
jgi:hypothetical protein